MRHELQGTPGGLPKVCHQGACVGDRSGALGRPRNAAVRPEARDGISTSPWVRGEKNDLAWLRVAMIAAEGVASCGAYPR
eukprot:7348709-Heterocapsa_arctica.AAC.1